MTAPDTSAEDIADHAADETYLTRASATRREATMVDRDVAIWLAGYRAACRALGGALRAHASAMRAPPGPSEILAEMTRAVGAAAAEGAARLTDGHANTTGANGAVPWPVLVTRACESIAEVDADAGEDDGPNLCPGCHSAPGEPHPPYCPDADEESDR